MEYPFKFEPLENNEEVIKDFKGYEQGLIKSVPGSWVLCDAFKSSLHSKAIYDFILRENDVWVITYPKSGTTWMSQIVWYLLNDLNFEDSRPIDDRCPFLDLDQCTPKDKFIKELRLQSETLSPHDEDPTLEEKIRETIESIGKRRVEVANEIPATGTRCLKSHLPFELLPPELLQKSKVIYIARDPRDVAVSYYHHHRLIRHHEYIGDFKKFFRYFINDQVLWSPYWKHIKQAWDSRDHPNLLIIFFEDMKKDIYSVVQRVSNFLGTDYSKEELQELLHNVTFQNMKHDKAVDDTELMIKLGIYKENEGAFVRKGESGGWRDYFNEDMIKDIDEWTIKNTMNTDIPVERLMNSNLK